MYKIVLFGDKDSSLKKAVNWLETYQIESNLVHSAEALFDAFDADPKNTLIIIDGLNKNANFVKVIDSIRAKDPNPDIPIILGVKAVSDAIKRVQAKYNISHCLNLPLDEAGLIRCLNPYIGGQIKTPKPPKKGSAASRSPYANKRLLITSADIKLVVNLRKSLEGKFEAIEAVQDADSGNARLRDSFAPPVHLVIFDQAGLKPRDVSPWRKTIAKLNKKPFMFLMQRKFDVRTLRSAHKLGVHSVLTIEQTFNDMIRCILMTTGHLSGGDIEEDFSPEAFLTKEGYPVEAEEIPIETYTKKEPQIEKSTLDSYEIPILPDHMARLKEILEQEIPDIKEISEQIDKDDLLKERVLKIANSVIYGAMSKASTIDRAISRIGMREFRKVVSGVMLQRSFSKLLLDKHEFSSRLWKYLVAQGVVFSTLYQLYHDQNGKIFNDDPYFVGVVSCGGMFLINNRYKEYRWMNEHVTTWDFDGSEQATWEADTFGTAAVEISAEISRNWNMSDKATLGFNRVTDSAEPNIDKESQVIADLLTLSRYFSKKYIANLETEVDESVLEKMAQKVGLEVAYLEAITEQLSEDISKYQDIFTRK